MAASAEFVMPPELDRFLREMGGRVGDMTEPMTVASRWMGDEINERFNRFGDGDWATHAAETIRRHGPHDMGDLTGNLSGSFGRESGVNWARAYNDSPTAHLFDQGQDSTRQPARPFVYFSDALQDRISHRLMDWVAFEAADSATEFLR